MKHLLFPGRHHLLTNFQLEYLTRVTNGDPSALRDVNDQPLCDAGAIETIIWAVTSANHSNTRRNPLSSNRREVAIEAFATQLDAESFVYLIDDIGTTTRFADYVLKRIEVNSQRRFRLTPENTIVGCSTPEIIEMYEQLGFQVLPVELQDPTSDTYCAATPWEVLMAIVRAGEEGRDCQRSRL